MECTRHLAELVQPPLRSTPHEPKPGNKKTGGAACKLAVPAFTRARTKLLTKPRIRQTGQSAPLSGWILHYASAPGVPGAKRTLPPFIIRQLAFLV
jgi:hypothetical protein